MLRNCFDSDFHNENHCRNVNRFIVCWIGLKIVDHSCCELSPALNVFTIALAQNY